MGSLDAFVISVADVRSLVGVEEAVGDVRELGGVGGVAFPATQHQPQGAMWHSRISLLLSSMLKLKLKQRILEVLEGIVPLRNLRYNAMERTWELKRVPGQFILTSAPSCLNSVRTSPQLSS